jgi:hypothetical protein
MVLTLLRVLQSEARSTHARTKGMVIIFQVALAGRLLIGMGIVGFSVLILMSIGHEETWLLALGAGLVVSACFAWPATLIIVEDGITRRLWWRPTLAFPWKEVSGIEKNQGGDLEVFGKGGQTITFTRFHVAPFRFQEEVIRRAKLSGVIDSSAFPSIRS